MTITRWTTDRTGCIFEGASVRTADELNAVVILLALNEGWAPNYAPELRDTAEGVTGWMDDDDDAECLADESRQAEEWLNEHVAPEGHSFRFDEGFYLWPENDLDD